MMATAVPYIATKKTIAAARTAAAARPPSPRDANVHSPFVVEDRASTPTRKKPAQRVGHDRAQSRT
jgi:hypothetical protein